MIKHIEHRHTEFDIRSLGNREALADCRVDLEEVWSVDNEFTEAALTRCSLLTITISSRSYKTARRRPICRITSCGATGRRERSDGVVDNVRGQVRYVC